MDGGIFDLLGGISQNSQQSNIFGTDLSSGAAFNQTPFNNNFQVNSNMTDIFG